MAVPMPLVSLQLSRLIPRQCSPGFLCEQRLQRPAIAISSPSPTHPPHPTPLRRPSSCWRSAAYQVRTTRSRGSLSTRSEQALARDRWQQAGEC